jgi:CheY-like chemotaxis protein
MKKKKVLVVDDTSETRELLGEIVEVFFDSIVIYASGGHQAFEIIKHNRFDLILCDLEMPSGCGFSLLSNIKTLLDAPPFVLVSGNIDLTFDQVIGKGANGFVQKPFSLATIQAVLTKYL